MSGLAIAILAAGSASRFGGGKLDAELAGKPLGRWALRAACGVEHERLAVVVGGTVPAFARAAGCELLVNDRAGEGLGTSAALAAKWAGESGSDALLIVLADMPLVSRDTLAGLGRAASEGTPAAVVYAAGPGAPAAFPAALFAHLEALTGDTGAAHVLRGRSDVMLVQTAPDELLDVDRSGDLAEIAKLLR
jgi:molybdenum cofactor cytidylyltransferase